MTNASTPSHRIAVVGSINADLSVTVPRHPKPGETLLGTGGRVLPGGKGANQAVAARQQGAEVIFIGAVGDDANATEALSLMKSSGVDTSRIETVDAPTGLAVISVDASGENAIVVVPGANALVDAAYVNRFADDIAACDIVLCQGELPAEAVAAAKDATTGRFLINLGPVIDLPREVLLAANPLIVNEHEGAAALAQLGEPDNSIGQDDLAENLVKAGFQSVIITIGKKGAIVAEPGSLKHVTSPGVSAVDTTGAGDAFAGVVAARLAAGDSLVEAARHASKVAALSVTRPGAQTSYPAADVDIDQALQELAD
ncbi:ribokinase [Corynebacterium sp. 13CS0277]|uniref:ribokinase n=1 Tax=Corynebacterium sp. 13CS0277 TaxID=2071994 RepID=UPI000D03E136|nr:ribokinase [Corynebacterium sp. 13CS0277]PRQ12328.1 ribokinase [Corynebacterium sp. 13CS0277]